MLSLIHEVTALPSFCLYAVGLPAVKLNTLCTNCMSDSNNHPTAHSWEAVGVRPLPKVLGFIHSNLEKQLISPRFLPGSY